MKKSEPVRRKKRTESVHVISLVFVFLQSKNNTVAQMYKINQLVKTTTYQVVIVDSCLIHQIQSVFKEEKTRKNANPVRCSATQKFTHF